MPADQDRPVDSVPSLHQVFVTVSAPRGQDDGRWPAGRRTCAASSRDRPRAMPATIVTPSRADPCEQRKHLRGADHDRCRKPAVESAACMAWDSSQLPGRPLPGGVRAGRVRGGRPRLRQPAARQHVTRRSVPPRRSSASLASRSRSSASSWSARSDLRVRNFSPVVQITPFTARKIAALIGLAEQHPELMLEEQPNQADRDGREDDHPRQPLVCRLHLGMPDRAEESLDDPDPVTPDNRSAARMAVATCSPTMNARYGDSGAGRRSGRWPSCRRSGRE